MAATVEINVSVDKNVSVTHASAVISATAPMGVNVVISAIAETLVSAMIANETRNALVKKTVKMEINVGVLQSVNVKSANVNQAVLVTSVSQLSLIRCKLRNKLLKISEFNTMWFIKKDLGGTIIIFKIFLKNSSKYFLVIMILIFSKYFQFC